MIYSTRNRQKLLQSIRANEVEQIKLRSMQSRVDTQRRKIDQLDRQCARLLQNRESADQLNRLRDELEARAGGDAPTRPKSSVPAGAGARQVRPLTAVSPNRQRFVQARQTDQYYADYQAWLRQCAAINAHNQKVLLELEREEKYRQVLKRQEERMLQGKLFQLKSFIGLKALEAETGRRARAEREQREALGRTLEKLRWRERRKAAVAMGLQGGLK